MLGKVDFPITTSYVTTKCRASWEKEGLVRLGSRIALVSLAVVVIFLLGCPMPQVGMGPKKEAAGDTEQGTPVANGASISVIMDEARNQAVYINENGQRFDVAAEEYPGGPLVACVQVAGFTPVPPSTDPEALPVKALIAGTRDDGNPTVWEVHNDDSIHLSQPETDPTGERCIVQDQMTTLPDGIQARLGWKFVVSDVKTAPDGKSGLIVGYAHQHNGLAIGGIQLLPDTTVALYWRVYSLLGGRVCIVSAPRIIGSLDEAPLPSQIAARWPGRSSLLQRLWTYLYGTLKTYLVADLSKDKGGLKIERLLADNTTFEVSGTSDKGLPALATIPKSGTITIDTLVPNLNVSTVAVSPVPNSVDASWSISASVDNLNGTASADAITIQYYLSVNGSFDSSATLLDTGAPLSLGAGAKAVSVTSPKQYSLANLKLAAGVVYYLYVRASVPYSESIGSTSIEVQDKGPSDTTPPTLTSVSIASSNANSRLAKIGDVVTVSFTASETLAGPPSVSIGGVSATATSTGGLGYAAQRTIVSGDREGPVAFTVSDFKDVAGNAGAAVNVTTDGTSVSVDTTAPTVAITGAAVSGTSVVVSYTVSETLTSGTATVTGASPYSLTGSQLAAGSQAVTLNLAGGSVYTIGFSVSDLSGNVGTAATNLYAEVVIDTYNASVPDAVRASSSTNASLWRPGATDAIASDVAGAARPIGWPYKFGAYIDYKGGLLSGSYYVLVSATSPGDDVDYGIRVITTPSSSYAGWTFTTSVTDPGDTPLTAPVPFNPALLSSYQTMQLGGGAYPDRLHRGLTGTWDDATGDLVSYTVNWVKVILP